MDLQAPDEIRLGAEVRSLLDDLEVERMKLRELGDFPPETRDELRKAFLPNRIADTLAIEGMHVSPRVTRSVLEGLALAEADRYAEQGVLNIIEANDFAESLASRQVPLSSAAIKQIHRRTMEKLLSAPGDFRREDVSITGAEIKPPPWGDVPDLVDEIVDTFETFLHEFPEEHPVVAACWLHVSLGAVHPFSDGNGRVARLAQDYALMRGSLLPVGIPAGRRQEYYDAPPVALH